MLHLEEEIDQFVNTMHLTCLGRQQKEADLKCYIQRDYIVELQLLFS